MPQRVIEGLDVVTFNGFDAHPGVTHAITTRHGGSSAPPFDTLNLGQHVGDDRDAVARNRERLARLVGSPVERVTFASQVHGTRVAVINERGAGSAVPDTDALITAHPGLPIVILVADCVVIGLYDPVRHVAGIAHAGWRGTLGGVAVKTVETMRDVFRTDPADLVASIGPSIGPCCYTVGPDVTDAFFAEHPEMADDVLTPPDFASAGSFEGVSDDRMMLDLWQANERLLAGAGVPPDHIETAGRCTSCETDTFFSHRAESGRTGRFAGVIVIRG